MDARPCVRIYTWDAGIYLSPLVVNVKKVFTYKNYYQLFESPVIWPNKWEFRGNPALAKGGLSLDSFGLPITVLVPEIDSLQLSHAINVYFQFQT